MSTAQPKLDTGIYPPEAVASAADTAPPEPYSVFSKSTKALIVALASGAAFIGPFGVNIYLPTLPLLAKDLDMDASRIMISVTVYMICLLYTSPSPRD